MLAQIERAYLLIKGTKGSPAGDVFHGDADALRKASKMAKSKTFNFFSLFFKFFLINQEILNFLSSRQKQRTLLYAYASPPDAFPPLSDSNFPAPS